MRTAFDFDFGLPPALCLAKCNSHWRRHHSTTTQHCSPFLQLRNPTPAVPDESFCNGGVELNPSRCLLAWVWHRRVDSFDGRGFDQKVMIWCLTSLVPIGWSNTLCYGNFKSSPINTTAQTISTFIFFVRRCIVPRLYRSEKRLSCRLLICRSRS